MPYNAYSDSMAYLLKLALFKSNSGTHPDKEYLVRSSKSKSERSPHCLFYGLHSTVLWLIDAVVRMKIPLAALPHVLWYGLEVLLLTNQTRTCVGKWSCRSMVWLVWRIYLRKDFCLRSTRKTEKSTPSVIDFMNHSRLRIGRGSCLEWSTMITD